MSTGQSAPPGDVAGLVDRLSGKSAEKVKNFPPGMGVPAAVDELGGDADDTRGVEPAGEVEAERHRR